MKSVYRVFAYLIALEVAIQASLMVFAVAGLFIWVDKDGGVVDAASVEAMFDGDITFTGLAGMMLHGINGMMIIPALALIFLIFSFFAKVPGGSKWAAFVLLAVVVQVTLGLSGHSSPYFGMLHGFNALILFSVALMAGMRVSRVTKATESSKETELV